MSSTIPRHILIRTLFIIGVIFASGCGKPKTDPPANETPANTPVPATIGTDAVAEAAQTDRDAEKSLSEPGKYEARTWLSVPHHSTFKISHDLAVKTVDDFYDAGATNVWVTGVETIDISDVAVDIIIEVPTESAARQRVFDVMREVDKTAEDEPTRDVGQKYFVFPCD